MGKLIKWLSIIVLLLIVIVAVAGLILVSVFDPNDYKDEIASLVKERTGRDLSIGKDIALTLFPKLGVELADVTLANPPGFGDQPFAHIDKARVAVSLMPLLDERIEVDTLSLDGLALNLITDRKGRNNWDDLAADETAGTAGSASAPASDGPSLAGLRIGGLEVHDLEIGYSDQRTGAHHRIELRRLRSGEIVPGGEVPLELELVAHSDQPPTELTLDAQATLKLAKSLQRFALPDLRARLHVRGEGLPKHGVDAVLSATLVFDQVKHNLRVSDLKLTREDLKLTGELTGSMLSTQPHWRGRFAVAPFALRKLLGELGMAPDTRDHKALEQVGLSFRLDQRPGLTRLDALQLRIDDSNLRGKASIGAGPRAPIRFDLDVDRLDLDRYLPPPKTAAKSTAGPKSPTVPIALPLAALRDLDIDGRLRIADLKLSGLHLSHAEIALHARQGVIRLKPLAARLYGGSLRVDATMNVKGDQPRFSLNKRLKGVRIGPLLQDMTGEPPLITGTANLTARLDTRGLGDQALRRALNGSAGFSFTDGALQGYDLAGIIRQAMAALKGKTVTLSGPQKTDFAEMKGSLRITRGRARNDDFSLKSPLLRVRGKGVIDLPEEKLDYLVTAKLVTSLEGQGGKDLEKLKGVPIPVRIRGPFRDPSVHPDLESLLKEAAKRKLLDKVREKAGGRLDEVLKQAGGGLGEALQGLFK